MNRILKTQQNIEAFAEYDGITKIPL